MPIILITSSSSYFVTKLFATCPPSAIAEGDWQAGSLVVTKSELWRI